MRHRRKGRVLGRSPSHQRALLRNLASALMLTEREVEPGEPGAAKVKGRIITTLPKAKEVRPLVERCITVARRGLAASAHAAEFAATAERGTAAWKEWRTSPRWREWAQAMAPVVKARRRVIQLLGDKHAARLVFEVIAPRFADRPGGYTRILKLAKPRLGDAGQRAILEFVGGQGAATAESPRLETARS
jgi:large subunit ribosomal protein L17